MNAVFEIATFAESWAVSFYGACLFVSKYGLCVVCGFLGAVNQYSMYSNTLCATMAWSL